MKIEEEKDSGDRVEAEREIMGECIEIGSREIGERGKGMDGESRKRKGRKRNMGERVE